MSGGDDLFDFARKLRYPEKPGHKAGGTSAIRDAALFRHRGGESGKRVLEYQAGSGR
jgi:hypothetical protein